jgi:hypothetical protein
MGNNKRFPLVTFGLRISASYLDVNRGQGTINMEENPILFIIYCALAWLLLYLLSHFPSDGVLMGIM